jgi:hypothetical protein
LAENKKLKKYESDTMAVFLDEKIQRPFVIKKPIL